MTKEQLRRFLLNSLRVGNPGDEKLWPIVKKRVKLSAKSLALVRGGFEAQLGA